MLGMVLWNFYLKVYLFIVDDGGEFICFYCGVYYVLCD